MSADRRSRRYALADVLEVRTLAAAGWSQREIRRILLSEHGDAPSHETLARWLSEGYAERARQRSLRANAKHRERRGFTFQLAGRTSTVSYQEAFVRRLDQEDLAATSIAKVCGVVFGKPFTSERVHKILEAAA